MSSEKKQSTQRIKKIAMKLDNALEKKDYDLIKSFFAEDCQIKFLEVTLQGRKGVEKWLDYIFRYVKKFKLDPITIMVEEGVFFEEFKVSATLPDDSKLNSKWAEVLKFENDKVQSLRLYFDRLKFAKSAASNLVARKILAYLERKTLDGLV